MEPPLASPLSIKAATPDLSGLGSIAEGLVDTSTGHGFTQIAAAEIVARILAGDFIAGFQTPASAYGAALLTSIGDSHSIDL